MSEFTADILIVIFVLYFISYLLILKELSYKNALKNENIELDTLTINFKERIVNVKLKDISTWSTEHLSKNWVTERTKTLRKVS